MAGRNHRRESATRVEHPQQDRKASSRASTFHPLAVLDTDPFQPAQPGRGSVPLDGRRRIDPIGATTSPRSRSFGYGPDVPACLPRQRSSHSPRPTTSTAHLRPVGSRHNPRFPTSGSGALLRRGTWPGRPTTRVYVGGRRQRGRDRQIGAQVHPTQAATNIGPQFLRPGSLRWFVQAYDVFERAAREWARARTSGSTTSTRWPGSDCR